MRKKLTQYGLTAALAMGAAGILPANVYGAVNTYNLPGGNGKMIVISGGNEIVFLVIPAAFPILISDRFPDGRETAVLTM